LRPALVLVGIVLVVLPTTVLMLSLGDSVLGFVVSVRDNTLRIPAPLDGVAEWPVVGKRVHGAVVDGPCGSADRDSGDAAQDR
jgi:hypothetical protein